ncbi:hypothetical protein BKA70DRAFT_362148 [Coprinopsis sp. MPI-PUGE-AT-0042]|nr:hypothetical protein BKA70DRAFT_362148 [Coprinopsis sp. MPI-PUGE-AT-0042]
MTETEANKQIAADIKDVFTVRSVDKAVAYFEVMPAQCHKELVEKLTIICCMDSTASDTFLVSAVFERVSTKRLCSALAFEQAFVPIAGRLKGISIFYPLAYELFVLLVVHAGLDAAACGLHEVTMQGNSSKVYCSICLVISG